MPLDVATVEQVAELAKLGLTDDEKARFTEQLSAILDYAARLQTVDTSAIPATATMGGLENVMRPDEARPSLSQADVLANAPRSQAGQFQVPAILD